MLNLARLVFTFTRRDWRGGELHLLVFALVVAVAALSSVSFLADRLQRGLQRDATQLLGADLVLSADRPLADNFQRTARTSQLQAIQSISFPSMALAGTEARSRLVSLFAVEPGYPLRGQLRIADAKQPGAERPVDAATLAPGPQEVWVDGALLRALDLQIGQSIQLGESQFRITQELTYEGPRGAGFANFAPRVLMRLADLPATALLQPGSRATWRLWVAGAATEVAAYQTWLHQQLQRGQRIETLENGRPEMRAALDRAQQFLGLVAVLAALLAAVAVALGARRFVQRHLDASAVMRCLGLTQARLLTLLVLEFVLVGLLASAVGAALGWGVQAALVNITGSLLQTDLPAPSVWPFVQGLATGVLFLLAFALPPLWQLRQVPPLRVLRRDLTAPALSAWLVWGLALAIVMALVYAYAGEAKLALLSLGGFALAAGVFMGSAWLLTLSLPWCARVLRRSLPLSWPIFSQALQTMQRRGADTRLQVVALSVGLLALLLLGVTRTDLLDAWRAASPVDAPNRFIINIQPDQREALNQALTQLGVATPTLNPMIRGRLISKNTQPLSSDDFTEDNAKRLIDREFNLSYLAELPSHNQISAGQWFAPNASAELSLEEGIAKTLKLKLGDELTFDIAGSTVSARVTSLRKLRWDSMRVNFFVIFPPAALEAMPQTWITAVYVPPAQAAQVDRLVQQFPNLTIVDTGAVVKQVVMVIDKVSLAVELLFGFTLAAGLVVLYAALLSSRDQRLREAALRRALGATRQQLQQGQLIEQVLIGLLAGSLAALLAQAIGWALAEFIFKFPWQLNPWVFLIGASAGCACALATGWLALRQVVQSSPLNLLREANE